MRRQIMMQKNEGEAKKMKNIVMPDTDILKYLN